MLKIAICDDELVYREHVIKECNEYFKAKNKSMMDEISFSEFSSGAELIASQEEYDILFLDIEMPDVDGIGVKEYFENNGSNIRIMFLTSHEDRMVEAFGKNVFCFLRKPLQSQEFNKAMDKVLSDISESVIQIEKGDEIIAVPIKQIKYVEAQDKYTILFTQTEKYLLRKTMKYWGEHLPKWEFVRINKSFLVNLEYFVRDKNEVILEKDKRIKISRKMKEDVMNSYKLYIRTKMEMM